MKIIDNDRAQESLQSGKATITNIYLNDETLEGALRAVAKYCRETELNTDDMRAIEIVRGTMGIDCDSLELWEVRFPK